MIQHYLTVAFRNMRKYKMQSVISIVGLSVGFTCFALASLWIRYEMTYDHFHRDVERIYHVRPVEKPSDTQRISSPWFLAKFLKETFPEIEASCKVEIREKTLLLIDENTQYVTNALVDSAFLKMFDVRLIEGNPDFLIEGSKKIAITEAQSRLMFGDKSPLGEILNINFENNTRTICAVVSTPKKHSNIYFQFLEGTTNESQWAYHTGETFIKLNKNTDTKGLARKLHDYKIEFANSGYENFQMTPLTSLRYKDSNVETQVKFQYLLLFAVIGLLVIICSLFNYMTLFVSRFRIRRRELALRTVLGASGKSLFVLFATEYLSVLLFALMLGLLFINISLPAFSEMSEIDPDTSGIYLEMILYIGSITLLSMGVFFVLTRLFSKQTLNASIKKINKNVFRGASIIAQLIISIGFIFCTVVMLKQIYFLQHVDMGADFRHTFYLDISPRPDMKAMENQLKQIPEIEDVLSGNLLALPYGVYTTITLEKSEDFPVEIPKEGLLIETWEMMKTNIDFYRMRLIAGDWVDENDPKENIMINEAAAKAFGWKDPVGHSFDYFMLNRKKLESEKVRCIIKGVLKDISILPTVPVNPAIFIVVDEKGITRPRSNYFLLRYQGNWKTVKNKIEQLVKKDAPNAFLTFRNADEEYANYIKSENVLLKLLSFVSFVCVIISVFGFFSLISLSCEERRKEIAIRKINGATMNDILKMYFKTYFSLLIIGAVIAFPIGYYIMRQWIEKYVKQTEISAWIYLLILFVMAFVIILCVGWRVYKA
ncbi:MAG: FtsX-like permease family protein, partial [Tannerella sp.]|nr:FtsX-like permease family protein [Tannerella sp.]